MRRHLAALEKQGMSWGMDQRWFSARLGSLLNCEPLLTVCITPLHTQYFFTVTIRPLSWKYLTRGMVFCLKLVRRRSIALGLSSGRPCCSARFCSLSFKRWLVQARNTTRSGVQICQGTEDTREIRALWDLRRNSTSSQSHL